MSIIQKFIVFAIWEFLWFFVYIIISDPFTQAVTALSGATDIAQVQASQVFVSTVFDVSCAFAMIVGFIYLFLAIHHREYEYETY
jgi:hypothetical protein